MSYLPDASPRRRPFLDFAAINDAARRALPYIVRQWLPDGRREDNEYVARNPKRCDEHLGSFKINVKTGMWADFATDARGRDVVSLASYLFDLKHYDAAASVARMLNLSADGGGGPMTNAQQAPFTPIDPTKAADVDDVEAHDAWEPILPVPDDAPPTSSQTHPRLGRPTAMWAYTDIQGRILLHVARFDPPPGSTQRSKELRPLTYCRTRGGGREWRWRGLGNKPWPLFNLQELADRHDAPVLVVEGEKKVAAAEQLFPQVVVTCSMNGAEAAGKTDWAPLKGRDVTVWPDHDGSGDGYAADVCEQLRKVGAASIKVVAIPNSFPGKWDLADDLPSGVTQESLRAVLADAKVPPEQWAAPNTDPVDLWAKFDPPPLPIGLLPEVIERFAVEQGEVMGADPCGLAVGALVVCAAALPDHVKLQTKKHDREWVESARLWAALIGEPSRKKTPILSAVAKPLKKIDARLWQSYVEQKEQYDRLTKDEREADERPKQTRLRIEDTTIEAAQEVLKDSPDGVLCLQDELSGWFGSMDKYSGHRGAAKDRGFWLQSYQGGSYAINRVARGPSLIENLSVSLLGGIQPGPMRKLIADTVDDGLIQRLVPIVLRPGVVGKDEPRSFAVGQRYAELVERLHGMGRPLENLHFDDGALAIRLELEEKHLHLMECEVVNKKLAAHIGKYDGLFARLCLLWHCIEKDPCRDGLVRAATARRVADFLHEFLLPHAIAFYAGVLGLSDDHDRLAAVAGYILAHKLERVTNRDIQRGDRTMRGLDRREIDSIFHQLDAMGWVTRTPGPRPSDPPHWIVNPEVHRLYKERAEKEAERRRSERATIAALLSGSRRPGAISTTAEPVDDDVVDLQQWRRLNFRDPVEPRPTRKFT